MTTGVEHQVIKSMSMTVCRILLLYSIGFSAACETFTLPPADSDLIGSMGYTHAADEDTLLDIARHFDLGNNEITNANPGVDRWLPGEKTLVFLPKRYILPDARRSGLVLNVSEMRMYYFPKAHKNQILKVMTYPMSIGRMDWTTPLGLTRVVGKKKDPTWTPPESIKAEHAINGDPLPNVVPPGPDNPLGRYAIRLGIPGYLIHSTNKPYGIGMRVSHGCIRMYPEDIEKLFPGIRVGTRVNIIDQPVKIGWFADMLYVEAHPPLEENSITDKQAVEETLARIENEHPMGILNLDREAVESVIRERRGTPVVVSRKPSPQERENPAQETVTSQ